MTTRELMESYLSREGFRFEKEDYGLRFKYEGSNFIFFANEEDNGFFQLAMPGILDIDSDNILAVYKAMDKTNVEQKVIKCGILGDSVWVFFEILIDSSPELDDFVIRALDMLKEGQIKFYTEFRACNQ